MGGKKPESLPTRPTVAVTLGDPAGVGPEIVARLFAGFAPARSVALLIGAPQVLEPWTREFGGDFPLIRSVGEVGMVCRGSRERVFVLDTGSRERYPTGRDSREGGKHALSAIEMACRLADKKLVDALVTAPISKQSLSLAGCRFIGHTEMLAAHFRATSAQMMMVYRNLRVVPLTRHLPIRRVSESITQEKIVECLEITNAALKGLFGVEEPIIALSALNPHGGDKGLIGDEEIEIIDPALELSRRRGVRVEGPVPGDSLFQSIGNGKYDAYITMYHDQGLIPFKMAARGRGVNLTLGLPVLRISVDHGVAFDIAGKGIADISSLRQAYILAERILSRGRRVSKREVSKGWKAET